MTREQLRAWAAARVAAWPLPTTEQRDRLAVLFAPARGASTARPARKAA